MLKKDKFFFIYVTEIFVKKKSITNVLLSYHSYTIQIQSERITEETLIIEMRTWCRKIGTVNIMGTMSSIRRPIRTNKLLNLLPLKRNFIWNRCTFLSLIIRTFIYGVSMIYSNKCIILQILLNVYIAMTVVALIFSFIYTYSFCTLWLYIFIITQTF